MGNLLDEVDEPKLGFRYGVVVMIGEAWSVAECFRYSSCLNDGRGGGRTLWDWGAAEMDERLDDPRAALPERVDAGDEVGDCDDA